MKNCELQYKETIIVDAEQPRIEEMSLSGSMELLDEDLEDGSKQIALMLNQAIENSAACLDK